MLVKTALVATMAVFTESTQFFTGFYGENKPDIPNVNNKYNNSLLKS